MPLKFYYWIHKIPPFPSPNPKHLAHFCLPASVPGLALALLPGLSAPVFGQCADDKCQFAMKKAFNFLIKIRI